MQIVIAPYNQNVLTINSKIIPSNYKPICVQFNNVLFADQKAKLQIKVDTLANLKDVSIDDV